MDRELAQKILKGYVRPEGDLFNLGNYLAWNKGQETACLDGEFTSDELEAIGWWMKNGS